MNFITLVPLIFNFILAFDDFPDECQELFDENIHPQKCCKYPTRKIPDDDSEKCKKLCKDSKSSPAGCCEIDCLYDATGVYKDGHLMTEKIVQLYENFLAEKGGGKYDRWMEIIEKSVDRCQAAVQKSSSILVCNIPEYITDFLDCVDSQNFLNCPNFTDSKPCNRTRSIAAVDSKCGIKIGNIFVINHRFWEQKKDDS